MIDSLNLIENFQIGKTNKANQNIKKKLIKRKNIFYAETNKPCTVGQYKNFFLTLILLKSLIYIRISNEFFFLGGGGWEWGGKNFY